MLQRLYVNHSTSHLSRYKGPTHGPTQRPCFSASAQYAATVEAGYTPCSELTACVVRTVKG